MLIHIDIENSDSSRGESSFQIRMIFGGGQGRKEAGHGSSGFEITIGKPIMILCPQCQF